MGELAPKKTQLSDVYPPSAAPNRQSTKTHKQRNSNSACVLPSPRCLHHTHTQRKSTTDATPPPASTKAYSDTGRANASETDTLHVRRLADSLQQVVEYDLSDSPAGSCPVVQVHRIAIKSAIRALRQTIDPAHTTTNTPSITPTTTDVRHTNMDNTPTAPQAGATARQTEDSPPPPAPDSRLTPRNLDRDLDMDTQETLYVDNDPMAQAVHRQEGGQNHGHTNPRTDVTKTQSAERNITEPIYAQAFRNSCGNPSDL